MYSALAGHLGSDQPFYAIQDPFLTADDDAPKTVEDIAQVYLKEILEIQPNGPYYLGGWSMGGLIAYHLALLLEQSERKVEIVIIVDQKVKEKYGKFNFWSENVWKGTHMMKMNIALRHEKYKKEKKHLASGFYGLLGNLTGAEAEFKESDSGPISPEVTIDPSSRKLIKELDIHMKAAGDYVPPPYSGDVHVIQCREKEKEKEKKITRKKRTLSRNGVPLLQKHPSQRFLEIIIRA